MVSTVSHFPVFSAWCCSFAKICYEVFSVRVRQMFVNVCSGKRRRIWADQTSTFYVCQFSLGCFYTCVIWSMCFWFVFEILLYSPSFSGMFFQKFSMFRSAMCKSWINTSILVLAFVPRLFALKFFCLQFFGWMFVAKKQLSSGGQAPVGES